MFSFLRLTKTARTSNREKAASVKLNLEALEGRTLLSGFVDNFEAPTLNSFWNVSHTQAGSITFPSTAQAHSGRQSVQFNSTQANDKSIQLGHTFASPVFGQFSVWIYDNGAHQASSNYISLYCYNTHLGAHAGILTFDYDLGPSNGGSYYVDTKPNVVNTGVVRSTGWHQFTIDTAPGLVKYSIDGGQVYSQADQLPFDQVTIQMFGPSWRPAWVSYFDDFSFVESTPVISPTTPTWNTAQGGVDLGYTVSDSPVTQATTEALYWSSSDKFADCRSNQAVAQPEFLKLLIS